MIVNTPPMGWNTWNTFGQNINEQLIRESVDTFIKLGLKDAGYQYFVIDDCWSEHERDPQTDEIVPSKAKFPNGMKAVADYVHENGLKFGMYSCAGYLTCARYPASYDYEWIDARTFAEWGVDFLKYDFCYHPVSEKSDILYKRMGLALANCGRDIVFSACSWGMEETQEWVKTTGAHLWRSTHDIQNSWASIKSIIEQLGSQEFPRIRIGIGNNFSRGKQVDFVLGGLNEDEMKEMEAWKIKLETCAQEVDSMLEMDHFELENEIMLY